jgi:hypothetical protein
MIPRSNILAAGAFPQPPYGAAFIFRAYTAQRVIVLSS